MKMTICLGGVLERAAVQCERSRDWKTKTLAFGLRELRNHINQVRDDPSRVGEFMELYVDDEHKAPSDEVK